MGKAFFVVCEAYEKTGVEKKVRAQARALHQAAGLMPLCVSPVRGWERLVSSQCRIIRQAGKASFLYYRYASLNWLIHLFLLKKMKNRYLIEINTLNREELKRERGLKGLLKRLFNALFEKPLLQRSRAVLAVSQQVKEDVLSLSPASEVRIMENGYEKREVSPEMNAHVAQKVHEWREKGFLVALFAGTFFSWSGADLIVKGLKNRTKVGLILAGFGPELNAVLSAIEGDLHERILYVGSQTEAELAGLYEIADFAYSSQALGRIGIQDARPLKTREYLAYGLPVVCGYGESHELLQTGLILSPEITMEELETICRRESKEERMQRALPLLSWNRIYNKMGDLFP